MSSPGVVQSKQPLTCWFPTRATAVKIALWYILLGALWILCSGQVLHRLVHDPALEELLENVKGWFFIGVTGLLLLLALDRYFREVRRSARLLQASEERWQIALKGAGLGVWDWNVQTNEVFRSPGWAGLLGFEATEMDDSLAAWEARIHPDDLSRVQREVAEHFEGKTSMYSSEHRVRCKDGSYKWALGQGQVMSRGKDGKPLRVVGIYSCIQERKQAEAALEHSRGQLAQAESQLRQSQKLEAIGQLAGGVAHDFNNILAAMMMNLGLLQLNPDLDPKTRKGLKDLDAAARRAAGLTRQLLMFGRRSVLTVKPLDLNEMVSDLLKMLRRLIGEHIDLCFEGKSGLPLVEADVGMLEQVLMNLTVNARDAMPKGGRITISTTVSELAAGDVSLHPSRRAGCFVCLSVSDNGCGMDSTILKHIFEPFFTTKEPGKGTGLGLATVHGIIAQHKGWVEVSSELRQGSTFRVYLPAAASAKLTAPASPEVRSVPRGKENILVVEDEAVVRELIGESLRSLGYQVHEAGTGQQAMTLWQMHRGEVDLVLTDMVMPEGMTGLELVEQLQALRPTLKAIIISGYSPEIAHAGAPARTGVVYLPKPFSTKVLADLVRKCLDQSQPAALAKTTSVQDFVEHHLAGCQGRCPDLPIPAPDPGAG